MLLLPAAFLPCAEHVKLLRNLMLSAQSDGSVLSASLSVFCVLPWASTVGCMVIAFAEREAFAGPEFRSTWHVHGTSS